MKYTVVIERAGRGHSAYLPDLPGCIATGRTVVEVSRRIRAAARLHVTGMREDGLELPEPVSTAFVLSLPARRAKAAGTGRAAKPRRNVA